MLNENNISFLFYSTYRMLSNRAQRKEKIALKLATKRKKRRKK
jgi:hypothetical protein